MYFVRSKGRTLRLRDMDSGEMQVVGPRAWVPFGLLPANMAGSVDADFDIREPKTQQDLDAIEAENAALAAEDAQRAEARAVKAAGQPVEPQVEPSPEAKPSKRRR